MSINSYNPPIWSFLWLLFSIITAVCLIILENIFSLFAIPFLIVSYHGLHEVMHNTIVPNTKFFLSKRKVVNNFLGIVGYGIIGHNFILVRYSHLNHHNCGRSDIRCTIDGGIKELGFIGYLRYYSLLFGFGFFLHEIAGYIYLFSKISSFNPLNINKYYIKKNYGNMIASQLSVLIINLSLFYLGGIYFLLIRVAIMIYWGFTQNVAHYRLEIEKNNFSKYASRTYRVPLIWNNLFFGATFHHLEHHVFPSIPGVNLNEKFIQHDIEKLLDGTPIINYGIFSYFRSYIVQLKGPPSLEEMGERWINYE